MKKLLALIVLIGFVFPLFAYADACTYGEAIIAFEQGNATRGTALMDMAAKDGDQRAVKYLANVKLPDKAPVNLPVTNLLVTEESQIAFVNK